MNGVWGGWRQEWKWPACGMNATEWAVRVPYWLLTLSTTLLPAIWLWWHQRQKKRHKSGRCSKCGYDLRASSQRCPECGTPVPADLVRKPVA